LARLSTRAGDREEAEEEGREGGGAVLHGTCSSVIRSLYEQVVREKGELKAQEVNLVMNSIVTLGWPGAGVVDGLCGRMEVILEGRRGRGKEKEKTTSSSSSGNRGRHLFALDEEKEEEEGEEEDSTLSSRGLILLCPREGWRCFWVVLVILLTSLLVDCNHCWYLRWNNA